MSSRRWASIGSKSSNCRCGAKRPMSANQPVRVLLVEDDEEDYLLTRDLLTDIAKDGFSLDWVTDYETGLEAIDRAAHDVYLLDYRLGPHNGLELLREAVARGCRAPIILITG